jgi:anti-sigma factor RsiW
MKEFTEITLEKIEDYLMGKLDATERTLFETDLATNADLREELEKTKRVQEAAVRSKLRNKIKNIQADKLAEWKNEATEQPLIKGKSQRSIWRIPTTFAAAASVLFTFYLGLSPVSLPDADTISERGSATTDSIQIVILAKYSTAITAFQNEDFATSQTLFDEIATSPNIRPYYQEAATWYGGVAQIETDPAAAKTKLDGIIDKQDRTFEISTLDRIRVWLKLKMSKLF